MLHSTNIGLEWKDLPGTITLASYNRKLPSLKELQDWAQPRRVSKSLEAGLLNKSSCLARTLGVTKFSNVRVMILVLCYLSQPWMLNKPTLGMYI